MHNMVMAIMSATMSSPPTVPPAIAAVLTFCDGADAVAMGCDVVPMFLFEKRGRSELCTTNR
jgi:hypothetical protein